MEKKFHVYIIESPSSVDLYHKRFEGEALGQTLKLSGIPSSFRLAVDDEAFIAAFYVGLDEYFKNNRRAPIIHISAHGDENGIRLTSKQRISWDFLRQLLIPVNKALEGGLLLCLSSCRGSSGCRMSMPNDNFPFFAIVSSTGSPSWSETNIAFSTFYHLFKKGKTAEEAVKAMKAASGNSSFILITSNAARRSYLRVLKEGTIKKIRRNIPKTQPKDLAKTLK